MPQSKKQRISNIKKAINQATSTLRKREARLDKYGLKDTSTEIEKLKQINAMYGNSINDIKALKLKGDEKLNEERILGEYLAQLKKALNDKSTTVKGAKQIISEQAKKTGKSPQQIIYEMKQDVLNTSYDFQYEYLSKQNQVDYDTSNQQIADKLDKYITTDIDDIFN